MCATICPKDVIKIELNNEGFYEPEVNEQKCISCGLCIDVCAYNHEDISESFSPIKSYAAWSLDENTRYACSSGGVAFELGRTALNKGYKVCGVRYDVEDNRAKHYIATNEEELAASVGSKYIQSYTLDGFKAIHRKEKYLVTGTPCQIDSFRRLIQKYRCDDNFILMDFFCHGVPSMLLWSNYLSEVKKNVGVIRNINWRNKFTHWHDSWVICANGNIAKQDNRIVLPTQNSYVSFLSKGDIFYKIFLGNACLGRACYEKCKYKGTKSAADIRIGDLWGHTYGKYDKGVSGVLVFTEKGNSILQESQCTLISHEVDVIIEGQRKECIKENKKLREKVVIALKDGNILKACELVNKAELKLKIQYILTHPILSMKKVYKKVYKKILKH